MDKFEAKTASSHIVTTVELFNEKFGIRCHATSNHGNETIRVYVTRGVDDENRRAVACVGELIKTPDGQVEWRTLDLECTCSIITSTLSKKG